MGHYQRKPPPDLSEGGSLLFTFYYILRLHPGLVVLTSPAIADRGSLYQLLVAATATDISARNQARGLPYEYPVTGTNR